MPIVHRQGDTRACGAATVASQSKLTFGGQPAALQGDVESHGAGAFANSGRKVTYQGKTLIAVGDAASVDSLTHTNTQAASGFGKASIG